MICPPKFGERHRSQTPDLMPIPYLYHTLAAGWSKYLNQEAPQVSQKAPKKAPKFFPLKSACILVKSATDLTPQTIFIAFLCIKLFQLDNFLKIIHAIIGKLFSIYLFYVK